MTIQVMQAAKDFNIAAFEEFVLLVQSLGRYGPSAEESPALSSCLRQTHPLKDPNAKRKKSRLGGTVAGHARVWSV